MRARLLLLLLLAAAACLAQTAYWRQLGGALSASGRTLPGIEARTPSDQWERPGQKVASHWPGMSYTVENPPNPRLEVKRIRGRALDPLGMAIPAVQLGLYSNSAPHKLLALGVTSENGHFDFGHAVPPGDYRLIAIYPGLCTANIPLDVNRRGSGKKIVLHMAYPGLGACSIALLQ